MKERINKPRAFLSYSSADEGFIERIDRDLRTCQITPWRDRNEIRAGRPWLGSIFEEGLPTCDVIIAYFTQNSANSCMVAKEVDAALVRQLADNGISLLTYVNQSETRSRLRSDLQALQSPVWNDGNYFDVLPSVVAEIWRSYMERNIAIATAQEKAARLEAELELQTLRASLNNSAFTPYEEREFQHIYSKLGGLREAGAPVFSDHSIGGRTPTAKLGECRFNASFIQALKKNIDNNFPYLDEDFLDGLAKEIVGQGFLLTLTVPACSLGKLKFLIDPRPTLLIFGLQQEIQEGQQGLLGGYFRSQVLNEKMYRFASWLDYHGKFDAEPSYEFIEFVPDFETSSTQS